MAEKIEIEPWVLIGPVPTPDGFAFDMLPWPFESREEAEAFRRNGTLSDRERYTAVLLKDSMYAPSHYVPMKKKLNDVRSVRDEAKEFTGMSFTAVAEILKERYNKQ